MSVTVFIYTNSINTGNDQRDNDLTSEDTWFDVATFPVITFQSTSVAPRVDGSFDLMGDLTIKGITRTDTIRFDTPTPLSKDWAGNDQVDFSGTAVINRQDYDVFGGDFWSTLMENGLTQLSDEVELEIDIHARRADYQARYESTDSLDLRKIILDEIRFVGIRSGMEIIKDMEDAEQLSSGILSTVGYTLNAWGMYREAGTIFQKRQELYPDRLTVWNQLGITSLYLGRKDEAASRFETMLTLDSTNSRATEYIRLIQKMN